MHEALAAARHVHPFGQVAWVVYPPQLLPSPEVGIGLATVASQVRPSEARAPLQQVAVVTAFQVHPFTLHDPCFVASNVQPFTAWQLFTVFKSPQAVEVGVPLHAAVATAAVKVQPVGAAVVPSQVAVSSPAHVVPAAAVAAATHVAAETGVNVQPAGQPLSHVHLTVASAVESVATQLASSVSEASSQAASAVPAVAPRQFPPAAVLPAHAWVPSHNPPRPVQAAVRGVPTHTFGVSSTFGVCVQPTAGHPPATPGAFTFVKSEKVHEGVPAQEATVTA